MLRNLVFAIISALLPCTAQAADSITERLTFPGTDRRAEVLDTVYLSTLIAKCPENVRQACTMAIIDVAKDAGRVLGIYEHYVTRNWKGLDVDEVIDASDEMWRTMRGADHAFKVR